MAYKHILIAVDLSPESKVLVEKAVSMARPYNAKVSLIHVGCELLRPLHRAD
ncbi:nucleotide-binding universal stress UspA family protein [Klebsiella variicola]|nr:nucleotide-binding universal stress UspA family protein [Klebsiella variicola]